MLAASQIFDGLFVNYNTVILYITVSRYYKSNIFIKPFGTMLSFHNSQELKDRLVLIAYRARWGCVLKQLEVKRGLGLSENYGFPDKLTQLAHTIWEKLEIMKPDYLDFTVLYYENIPVGKDLTLVPLQFIRNILAPESLVMPNAYKSETVYYFECRQKIKNAFLEIAKQCQKALDGEENEFINSVKLAGIKDYLGQFEGDPMCEIGLCAINILESFDTEENGSDYREQCEKLLSSCAYIWEQFGVKNSSLWFRNLLFSLVR